MEDADADLVTALHAEHGHKAEADHCFRGFQRQQHFGAGLYFDSAVLLPVVNREAVDVLELAGAQTPFFFAEGLADESHRRVHSIAPKIIGVCAAFGHLLKLEFFDWAAVLPVGLAKQDSRHCEADAAGFGKAADLVPDGVLNIPFIIVAKEFGVLHTEQGGVGGGDEGGAGEIGEHGDAGEEFNVVDPGAEEAVAAEEGPGLAVGGSGGEEMEKAGAAKVVGGGDVGEEFSLGDVEDIDFELGVSFDVTDEVIEAAPGGFKALK